MKTNLRAICAAALVLFTGCSGKSSSTAKVNLSDISKNTELGEYDNLSVRCNVTLPQVEKLCTFSIKGAPCDDPDENSETNKAAKQKAAKLIESYSGKKPGDDEIIFRKEEYNSGSLVSVSFDYTDTSTGIAYSYAAGGGFTIRDTGAANDVHNAECLSYAFINGSSEVLLDSEIKGFSAQEAIELCNREAAGKLSSIIPEDELVPHSIASYRFADGSSAYCVIYAKKLNGLTLAEAGDFGFCDTGFIKPSYVCVQVNDMRNIYSIINFYPNVYEEASMKEIENGSFITLPDALGLLSDYLAENKTYEVEGISMVYFLPTRMKEGSSEFIYTEYIPGYEVILESRSSSQSNLFPRKAAYIDMVTGKIYISDPIDQIRFFNMD